MFKKDNLETPPDKIDTVIGKECTFNGKITGKGLIRIDGVVDGEVANQGDLIIGESGKVEAGLKARNITIAGQYAGTLEAEGKLELKKTASAIGNFKANDLLVEEGAIISGSMEMQLKEGTELKVKEAPEEVKPERREWSYKPIDADVKERRKNPGVFSDRSTTDRTTSDSV